MKSNDFLDALSGIDPKLIESAAPGRHRAGKSRLWIRFIALSACVALLSVSIPVGIMLARRDQAPNPSNSGPATGDDSGLYGGSSEPGGGFVPNTTTASSALPGSAQPPETTAQSGATAPVTTTPDKTDGVTETVSGNGSGIDLNYLTARVFNPNRSAGAVSDDFCAAYADFALKLLTSCRADQGSDTLISPLSLMTALAMSANGADGDTLAQMEALLGETDIETLNQQIFNLYASLSSTESASFKAANSIWVTTQPHFSISPDFLDAMENTYDADVIGIDFAEALNAANAINYWCNQKTDGMIPKIALPDGFDVSTVMALLNALTFDAKWQSPYHNKYQCFDGIFHGTNGDTSVTMLHDTLNYGEYLEGERETGFIRYYEGKKYAFVALLPDEEGDIADYLSTLTGSYLLDLIQNPVTPSGYTVSTDLPAFKQENSLKLNEILQSLGMPDAFNALTANFSKLGNSDSGIFIDQVVHKTFIEVNNEGTRAAAVTELDVSNGGMHKIKYVTLDRPFVYAIIDTATSLPIFIGSCENVT